MSLAGSLHISGQVLGTVRLSFNSTAPSSPMQLVHMVSSGERLQVPPRESAPGPDRLSESEYAAYVALMQRCWAQEPAERPGFDQIISQLR